MFRKMITEYKKIKERERVKKGLDAWYNIIKEMEASGEYTEEQLNNITLWFAEGCLQYANMFTE